MADSSLDDVYDDPDNILADDDDVNGAVELPEDEEADPSQSIYVPEKHTTDLDDRGDIDELELSDTADDDALDETTDPALLDEDPTNFDGDSYRANVDNADEKDGTEE
jgi:hypothetical protein